MLRRCVLAILLCVVACQRLSLTEQKLIGTWESHSMDASWRITYNPDHTLALGFWQDNDTFPVSVIGTWRIEGKDLIENLEFIPNADVREPKRTTRKTFLEFTADSFRFYGEYPYVRVK